MSLILSLRMANELKNYLPELDTQMSDGSDYDMQPMPFVIM